jgi:hypothetical protein
MASEYGGDLYDFQNMTDDEIREVVLEHLREQDNLELDDIDVQVADGTVTLAGRVGTDNEVQVAGSVLDDVLGIDSYVNDLVVDELRRGDMPTASDDSSARDRDLVDPRGSTADQQSDTADHLVEDLESETLGTRDPGRAIRDGASYTPPEGPVGDGYGSREDH